jgi:hypothetical protein
MAQTTRQETLIWNGSMQGIKLRVLEMQELGEGLPAKLLMWDVWDEEGIALATGRVPNASRPDGTDDVDAMVKHGARIAKATARAIVLKAVAS